MTLPIIASTQKGHIDPFLKLHIGIPVMFTLNADVPNGIANGTLCFLKSIKLKSHVAGYPLPTYSIDDYIVNVVSANDVEHLLCQHENSTETFKIELKQTHQLLSKCIFKKCFEYLQQTQNNRQQLFS